MTHDALSSLIGSPGRAGPISKATIAQMLEVSESTVSRWVRGHGVPDEETFLRLRWLHRQRRTWYLRCSDFVLGAWTPLERREDEAEILAEALAKEASDVSEVTYAPTGEPHIVKCRFKLGAGFQSITLFVLGPKRHELLLSHTDKEGSGATTLRFDRRLRPAPRRDKPKLTRGSDVEFYLHYLM